MGASAATRKLICTYMMVAKPIGIQQTEPPSKSSTLSEQRRTTAPLQHELTSEVIARLARRVADLSRGPLQRARPEGLFEIRLMASLNRRRDRYQKFSSSRVLLHKSFREVAYWCIIDYPRERVQASAQGVPLLIRLSIDCKAV